MPEILRKIRVAFDVIWKIAVLALLVTIALDVRDIANGMYDDGASDTTTSATTGTL